MFSCDLKFVLLLGAACFFSEVSVLRSGAAVSPPVGYVTVEIPAAPNSTTPSRTVFSLQLHDPADVTGQEVGRITDVGANTISNSSAGWSAGALSVPSAPYFIRITSGAAEGRTFQISSSSPNTATTLTVDNQGTDLTGLGITTGANGDTYAIIPGDTLISAFGSDVLSGDSADVADNILYWNGVNWQTFYYHRSNNRWQQIGIGLSADHFVLRPDAGLMYVRRATSPLKFMFTGTVPTHDLQYVLRNGGKTFVANGFPVNTTLAAIAFDSVPGWEKNDDADAADQVLYWNGVNWQRFYYHKTNARWQQAGINLSANNFTIPAGSALMIARAGSATGVTTFLHDIPYNLE